MQSKEEIENKIKQLEKDKDGYLEIDNKAGVRRKEKQIQELENQLELIDLKEIKEELKIYRKFIKKKELESELERFYIVELARK